MVKVATMTAAVLLASVGAVYADGVTIVQEGKKFSETTVTIKRGQSVTFDNKDPITHNVYSTTPGMAFDLKTQHPGEASTVTFDNAGTADVQCAIHPQMKMKVVVTE